MTTPPAEGDARATGTPDGPVRARTAASAITILLLAGLALRLTIAYVLFPGSGFGSDIGSFTSWALTLADVGPGQFYASAGFADYPPGYLYVLWVIGGLAHLLAPVTGGEAAAAGALIKVPAILADIAIGYVIYRLVRNWAQTREDAPRLALLAAAIWLFNPVTWYDSALWGQVDSVGALVMLLGVAALVRGNSEGAALLTIVAGVIKPQFGVVLAPLVGAVLLRRHLLAAGSGPINRPLLPAPLRSWFAEERGGWRLVSSGTVALATLLVLITPFSLDLPGFLGLVAETAGGYPYLTVNAYNPWALVGSEGNPPLAFHGGWSSDQVPFIFGIPAVLVGTVLLAGGFLAGVARAIWRDDRRSIVLVAVYLSLAFFVLPTRVHERYLFPVFVFLPLLAVTDRRWLWATVVLSAASFINLHGILTVELYGTPNVVGLPFGELFRSPPGVVVSALLHAGVFVFTARALRRTEHRVRGPRETGTEITRAPTAGDGLAAPTFAAGPAAASTAASGVPVLQPPVPGSTRDIADGWAGPPPLSPRPAPRALPGWLQRMLDVAPVRRDRSRELAGEPGGRLARVDLLLLAAVFLSAMGLRTFRLSEPYDMHFDEVYHARTATEFLQHWRYDMPHWIYEYTHPHMAKYLIALGLIGFGNDRVTGTAELGTSVKAAAIETRWSPPEAPSERRGDRLYAVTARDVRAYDLWDRRHVATVSMFAEALTVDEDAHRLLLADGSGGIWSLGTDAFDRASSVAGQPQVLQPTLLARLDGVTAAPRALGVAGGSVIVVLPDGSLVAVDAETGETLGRGEVTGATELVGVSGARQVVADTALVDDPPAAATRLAELLDDDAARIEALLESAENRVLIAAYPVTETADALQEALDAGELTGVTLESGDAVAVAGSDGVSFLDPTTLEQLTLVGTDGPAAGLTLVEQGLDQPTLYVATGRQLETIPLKSDEAPAKGETVPMPNDVRDVVANPTAVLVHALGTAPDGTGSTLYVVEPHANAVFADARLPFDPRAVLVDAQPERPSEDRHDILALAATGTVASVDAGSHAFAWRLPGVIAGALTAAFVFLLGRFLFRRRAVAVMAAILVLADGMFFANARIAMNDTYVQLFIVAAVTLFAPIWLGRWRGPLAVGLGLPAVGLLLGLALATKWVGAYAIGAVILLVLLRSALGRLIALGGMVALTAVLGYVAITPGAEQQNPQLNFLFLLLMVGLTTFLAAAIVWRPVRFTVDELRFAVLGPVAAGMLVVVAAIGAGLLGSSSPVSGDRLLIAGGGLLLLGGLIYLAAWGAGRIGLGPLAPPTIEIGVEPPSPPPEGWLRPGTRGGVPWVWAMASLTLVPLVVYVLSFYPWVELGNRYLEGFPAGNTGQLFLELQKSMYEYHNNLRATHAASSPWWAWPFDLKPVWFFQDDFANATTGAIYDSGNIVIFWLSIPAVAFAAYQAWRRRSLALTLLLVAIACLWLPWARIDRATFQYHIFTTLPFSFLALAYFLAELWHGPSPRTWLLARVSAAIAILGPAVLWLFRMPLCGLAGTEREGINPGAESCGALEREVAIGDSVLVSLGVLLAGLAALIWILRTPRARGEAEIGLGRSRRVSLQSAGAVAVAAVTLIAVIAAQLVFGGEPVLRIPVYAEVAALLAIPLLLAPAYVVIRARDSRRFAAGIVLAAVVWFAVWYPNLSGLPLPTEIAQVYQGFLPTYNYAFQFGVNLDEPYEGSLVTTATGMLLLVVGLLVVAVMYAARAWRAEVAARRLFSGAEEPGPA